MIDRLQVVAVTLYRVRHVFTLLAVLSALIVALSLFEAAGLSADVHLVPALVSFCWSVTLISFASLFAHVPGKPDKSVAWRRRLSIRLQRLFLGALGLSLIGLSVAVLVLSWQLLRTWLSA